MNKEFYLQDNRDYVGNDILFWRIDSKGYTRDLNDAEVFTMESAIMQNSTRETDIPWPRDYIDSNAYLRNDGDGDERCVDSQHVDIGDALSGLDIELKQPKPYRKPVYRCYGCGRMMTECAYYSEACINCGCYNRP